MVQDIVDTPDDRFKTGIEDLDKKRLKGLKNGNTVVMIADPQSMAFQLLRELAKTERKTKYMTNIRSEHLTKNMIGEEENVDVRDTFNEKGKSILEKMTQKLEEKESIIVETVTKHNMETSKEKFIKQMRNLNEKIKEKEGLAYLYLTAQSIDELDPYEKEVVNMSDTVFKVQSRTLEGNIVTTLEITKLNKRDEFPSEVTEPLRLKFGDEVRIDRSKKIR